MSKDKDKIILLPTEQVYRLLKISVSINKVQGLVIVVLAIALATLFPLKEKVPVYVEFQNGRQHFLVIARGQSEINESQAVLDREIQTYINARESVDKVTEKERYDLVYRQSSEEVWKPFWAIVSNKNVSLFYKKNKKRSINITRYGNLTDGVYQVEYETIDKTEGSEEEDKIKEWVATMSYTFNNQLVSYEDKHINPLGLQITEYTVASRRTKK